jgi:hypothetical protein
MDNQLKTIIRAEISVPETIQRLANIATLDLYFGPYTTANLDDEWERKNYTFQTALESIRNWADTNLQDCWIDVDCGAVMDREPEGYLDEETGEYVEPYLDQTYYLTAKELLAFLFNKTLVEYI